MYSYNGEKEGDLTQSYGKNPYNNRQFNKARSSYNTKTSSATPITQRSRTDLSPVHMRWFTHGM